MGIACTQGRRGFGSLGHKQGRGFLRAAGTQGRGGSGACLYTKRINRLEGFWGLLAHKPRINRLRGSGGCFTQVRGGSGACFEHRVEGLWGSEAGVSREKCSEAEIPTEKRSEAQISQN